jgi:hypothetical protein
LDELTYRYSAGVSFVALSLRDRKAECFSTFKPNNHRNVERCSANLLRSNRATFEKLTASARGGVTALAIRRANSFATVGNRGVSIRPHESNETKRRQILVTTDP